jgi:hypothetical protein
MPAVKITQPASKDSQAEVLKNVAEKVMDVEMQMPPGGSYMIHYEKNKYEHIGLSTNVSPPTRKHNAKFRPKAVEIDSDGSFQRQEQVQYVEEVENSRFPCGFYNIEVGNRYNLTVGSGGMGLKTAGSFKIAGDGRGVITAGDELYMSSQGNINVASNDNVSIVGKSLTLETPNQVVVNSNLGVNKNMIVNGGAFIDGEVFLNHISCPAEVQYTGGGIGSYGQLMVGAGPTGSIKGNGGGGAIIAYADVSYIKRLYDSIGAPKAPWTMVDKVPVMVLPDSAIGLASSVGNSVASNPPFSVFVYPHEHPFNNIPLSFTTGNNKNRDNAAAMNSGQSLMKAKPISHGYKTPQ